VHPEPHPGRETRRIDLRSLPLPPPELEIAVRNGPPADGARTVVVAVCGELDIATTEQLRTCLGELLRGGHCRLRLELAELTFCDVGGLSVLLQTSGDLRAAGGQLVLVDPPRSLERIVAALHLEQALSVSH
jgi:anti-anti-sigma factor